MARGDEAWIETGNERLADYGIFRAARARRLGPHGKEGSFVILDAPDWAVVVPAVVRDGKRYILSVRQYRHGSGVVSAEFPGGVVEPGEDPAAAAARELLEETGYAAGRVVRLGSCSPNPAFMTNTFHVFAAEDLTLVAEQSLDEHELVDVEEIPEDELYARVGEPPWSHALMIAAACFYERYRGGSR